MVQDVFSKLQIILEKAVLDPGFYHNKHYVILQGRMEKTKFHVKKMSHPIVNDSYKETLKSKNIDYYGYTSKYLNLLSSLGEYDGQTFGSEMLKNNALR
jgi:hypothetical protein